MIEGHYQYNGSRYQFYETLQPGYACEDSLNHVSCKAMSAKRNAELSQADLDAKAKEDAAKKAEIEASAVVLAAQIEQDQKNAAGRAKWDARRVAGRVLLDRQAAARELCSQELAAAQGVFIAAEKAAWDKCNAQLAAAQNERDLKEAEINAVDWLQKVVDEQDKADQAAKAARAAVDAASAAIAPPTPDVAASADGNKAASDDLSKDNPEAKGDQAPE